ncbi:hypothetical protein K2Z84_26530 [Candidatus Binatia bacterium]|nr:hypothetical protein [Candidatus Binatia bacterium]
MKARVPVIVKDPVVAQYKEIEPTESLLVEEDVFLDGPVSPRVAVLDFDPATGGLAPRVPFQMPQSPHTEGTYLAPPIVLGGLVDPAATAVSVFGAVHKTMRMFEEADALGRRVSWAFDAPQLLVVPRAGEWANAYYERESHGLQFFSFTPANGPTIHTAHSQDIVAHETAHALLDGIAPDLYGSVTPQALAIHEAVADLAALLCSFRCRELAQAVLARTGGLIAKSSVFSGLAEQFGSALHEYPSQLRDLNNDKSLRFDAAPQNRVSRSEPHALSEVLSGAFYRVLLRMYDELRKQFAAGDVVDEAVIAAAESSYVQERVDRRLGPKKTAGDLGKWAKALFVAGERLKRTLLRGLDYLPPGDVGFADLARAVIASDQASHPDSGQQREWLREEFVRRGIVASRAELEVQTNVHHDAVAALDLAALVRSDYAAYDFANRNRALLGIPEGVTFEVRPRLDVTKLYWHRDDEKREVRECLLKVAWSEVESSPAADGLPPQRRVLAGTTLAIEWTDPPLVRAVLTTQRHASDRQDTDDLILRLLADDTLKLDGDADSPMGGTLRGVVAAEVSNGVLRVRNAGRTLHVTRRAGHG